MVASADDRGAEQGRAAWRAAYDASPLRDADFETMSGISLEPVYGPEDWPVGPDVDAPADGAQATIDRLGMPGQAPFTRGPYASMYRSKLWTMRMFAGFGTAEDTNVRFRELLRSGGGGLSVAFDLPTLMGRDSDDPHSEGEVGRCGVAVDTLADVEDLFADIDLGAITTSMTINSPAAILLAMYVIAGRRRRYRPSSAGRHSAERHVEGVPGAEGVHLPAAAFDARGGRRDPVLRRRDAPLPPGVGIRLPHPRGGLDRRTGAGLHLGQRVRLRGSGRRRRAWPSTTSLPGSASSSTPISTSSRRSPSTGLPVAFGHAGWRAATGRPQRSQQLRFHTQTAGVSLTAQQPEVNIVRTAIEALAGVLGGTQSLHTNSMDEVFALPTEKAARIALRTQQVHRP